MSRDVNALAQASHLVCHLHVLRIDRRSDLQGDTSHWLKLYCGHEANHSEILYCFNTNVFDLHGPLQVLTLTIHFLNEVCFVGVKVSTADSSASQLL